MKREYLPKAARLLALVLSVALGVATMFATAMTSLAQTAVSDPSPQLHRGSDPYGHAAKVQAELAEAVRHQLAMLPRYGVFDWISAEITPDGTVVLNGQTINPVTKDGAQSGVKRIEGVPTVVNDIEVLPLSSNDDRLRFAVYRAIYRYDSPVFLYSNRANPSLHIIVAGGRVTLKGVVARKMDSQLAYTAAMGVFGVFSVSNELRVESD
jgi:hyperosmotically inducible protein